MRKIDLPRLLPTTIATLAALLMSEMRHPLASRRDA